VDLVCDRQEEEEEEKNDLSKEMNSIEQFEINVVVLFFFIVCLFIGQRHY